MQEIDGMAKKYSVKENYKLGDEIFHPYWSDQGLVSEIGETESGTKFVVVDFKRMGKKKLVQQTELKTKDMMV